MTKRLLATLLLVLMLFAVGCNNSADGAHGGSGDGNNSGTAGGSNVEEKNNDGEFFFKGKITSLDGKNYIEVEIIDSKIAFGTYWVLIGKETVYQSADGDTITLDELKVGDTIEIIFSGQVMMSYPPKISAQKIILK